MLWRHERGAYLDRVSHGFQVALVWTFVDNIRVALHESRVYLLVRDFLAFETKICIQRNKLRVDPPVYIRVSSKGISTNPYSPLILRQ
jgi:hypothetical protein